MPVTLIVPTSRCTDHSCVSMELTAWFPASRCSPSRLAAVNCRSGLGSLSEPGRKCRELMGIPSPEGSSARVRAGGGTGRVEADVPESDPSSGLYAP